LRRLLDCIPSLNFDGVLESELTSEDFRRLTLARLHSVVHVDPIGTMRGLEPNGDSETFILVSGPMLRNPIRFSELADVTTICLTALFDVTERAFPAAEWPFGGSTENENG